MSTAITDALWRDNKARQLWLVIPDDVDPEATRATLNLEQLDSGWIWPTLEDPTAVAAVEQALTASGWHPSGPWHDVSSTRVTTTATRETR